MKEELLTFGKTFGTVVVVMGGFTLLARVSKRNGMAGVFGILLMVGVYSVYQRRGYLR